MNGTSVPQGIANSHYAHSKKELVGVINEIRSSGAQLVVDLPRIAVIGNQSVGKSSLIEAISAIKVPRDSGTCTRCPMEVRLQSSHNPWWCQVRLRFEVDTYGKPLPAVREITFGPRISDPDRVEGVLKRAQLAILNPSVDDATKFVELTLPLEEGTLPLGSLEQLEFSPNLICIDVSGPEVTDLAFVDLPGIVSNKEPYMIELVKSLVLKHIRGNCIILVALTIGDDLENQSAALLARQEDPQGKRTMGVLTKADRLPPGEEEKWLKVLRNKSHPLRHGYYCTKLSSAAELQANTTFAAARKMEASFFSSGMWATVEPSLKRRLGTQKLTLALSDRLVQFILEILPGLITKVREQYDETVGKIRGLPTPPSADAALELLQLATVFCADAEKYCTGTSEHESLVQGATSAYKHFKFAIQSTVPHFIPWEKNATEAREEYVEPDFLKHDIEGFKFDESERAFSLRLHLDLDDTRERIKKAVTRELPFNVPFSAKSSLIQLSMGCWKQLSVDCLDAVRPVVNEAVEQLVQKHFGRFEGGPLRGKVSTIIDAEIERRYDVARSHVLWLCSLDDVPYTQNSHYFSATREKVLTHYHEMRQGFDSKGLGAVPRQALTSALAGAGLPTDLVNIGRILPVDSYEEELITMAETRAFFQIAFKRIIDDIPRAIDADFVRPLAQALLKQLVEGLGIHQAGGAENARAWLAESQEVALEREELGRNKELLEKARQSLSSFGMSRAGARV